MTSPLVSDSIKKNLGLYYNNYANNCLSRRKIVGTKLFESERFNLAFTIFTVSFYEYLAVYIGYFFWAITLDFLPCAQGILEALEVALKSGFRPKRTFFISFGHDEEVQYPLPPPSPPGKRSVSIIALAQSLRPRVGAPRAGVRPAGRDAGGGAAREARRAAPAVRPRRGDGDRRTRPARPLAARRHVRSPPAILLCLRQPPRPIRMNF